MPRTGGRGGGVAVDVEDLLVRVKNGTDHELAEVAREVAALTEQGRLGEEDDEDGVLVPALLARLAGAGNAEVRVRVMAALRRLARCVGCESKERLASIEALSSIVRSLSRDVDEAREAIALLLDLSDIPQVRQRIGRIKGSIVMLVTLRNAHEPGIHDDAEKLLHMLSSNPQNVLLMAEAGYFRPLIHYLKEGSDMNKILMATAISKMFLSEPMKSSLGEDDQPQNLRGALPRPRLLLRLLGFLAMAAPPQPVPAPAAARADVRLGFIGPGSLAESIARGVAASGVLPATAIRTAPHRRPERAAAFASIGAHILDTNAQVVDDSNVIVISVKPQIVRQVLVELKPLLSEEKLLVSIAAGIKMEDLQGWSGHRRIIRVMPNTPSAVGQAASVMCLGEMATENDENCVRSLFSAIGKVWTAEEKYFDAVTGLSGSGPAYIFLAIEAMADGGVAAGLPRDLALGLASQTVLGAATMVNQTGKHPGQLKDMVTSPAGTTITGIQELEKGAFRGTLINAVVAATKRCRELSQS
ncbi:hypothetical protein E2562_027391 [Oryza meyeriana var. granulata]|uniref:Pyrroline-5-carboxylate reductase n=1 Tax=Oryza meyeriana var. granulata TaxID=110450 RepID=A0A6G1EQ81_9ORYZ|nr:hypothetical protein E2562_027391 [Oryza meyeriana var. granulata]